VDFSHCVLFIEDDDLQVNYAVRDGWEKRGKRVRWLFRCKYVVEKSATVVLVAIGWKFNPTSR